MKKYFEPVVEIVTFECSDVITASEMLNNKVSRTLDSGDIMIIELNKNVTAFE